MIEKTEMKYILYSGLFAVVYFMFLLIPLQEYIGTNPYHQFLVFNIGLFILFFIFFKSLSICNSTDLGLSFGLYLLFFAMDIFLPEYHVTMDGKLVEGSLLGTSTADYIVGLTGQSMGFAGILLFLFTYVLVPIIVLFLVSKLLPNFVRRL